MWSNANNCLVKTNQNAEMFLRRRPSISAWIRIMFFLFLPQLKPVVVNIVVRYVNMAAEVVNDSLAGIFNFSFILLVVVVASHSVFVLIQ